MDKNDTLTPLFFKNLGKLFYAIAASDKKVEALETNTLVGILQLHWATINFLDPDGFEQLLLTFNRLQKEGNQNSEACYLDFVTYKNEQKHMFTDAVKHLILQTSNAIASSFASRNKSELIILAKLEIELKKDV